MHFCPNCNSLVIYDNPSGKLQLICQSCGFKDELKSDQTLVYSHSNISNTNNYTLPTPLTKYDQTLYSTSKPACPNTECTELVPQVLMFNRPHQNRTIFFCCAACGTSWTPSKFTHELVSLELESPEVN